MNIEKRPSAGRSGERFHLIDGIRGLAVVNMTAFHFLYDWHDIFHGDSAWYWSLPVRIWQQCICWTFILVSGFVWEWGRKKNLQRGLLLNLFGCLISGIMWLFMPEQAIWFGILNFYGCAVLLTIPLEKLLKRVLPAAGFLLSLALFLLTRDLQLGYIGTAGRPLAAIPSFLYKWKPMTVLGFPFPGFYSTDYYPVFPWYFLFLCGFWLQQIFRKHAGSVAGKEGGFRIRSFAASRVPFLSAAGRYSLRIYLLHQPVCFLAAAVLTKVSELRI